MKAKSKTRAYLYSIFGFLIPCWIADWALMKEADLVGPNFYVFFAIGMFALSSWGISLGLFYLGQRKYPLLAGLGRIGVVALFSIYDMITLPSGDESGHPYLTFIGIVLAFGWGTYDLARISFAHKKLSMIHQESQESSSQSNSQ